MVADPVDCEWPSYRRNAFGEPKSGYPLHSTYLALGTDFDSRCVAYKSLVDQFFDPSELDVIRGRLERQNALASDRFRTAIETVLNPGAGPA